MNVGEQHYVPGAALPFHDCPKTFPGTVLPGFKPGGRRGNELHLAILEFCNTVTGRWQRALCRLWFGLLLAWHDVEA